MVRGRLTAVDGRAVSEADYDEERAKRLVEREFNLSYLEALPSHNQLVGRPLVRDPDARSSRWRRASRSAWAGSSATS